MPAYRRDGKELPKWNLANRAGFKTWGMKKASKELRSTRQRPVIQSQLVPCELEDKEEEILPVRALMPARVAPMVSEERHGISHTVESKKFLV